MAIAAGSSPLTELVVEGPQRVLYVNLEVGEGRFQERLRRLQSADPGEACLDNLQIYSPGKLKVDDDHSLFKLAKQIRDCQADVVVLDPLRRVHDADENSSTAMAPVFDALNWIASHAALVIVHHTGKAGLEGRSRGQDSPRGTSDFAGWPDTLMWIESRKDTLQVDSILRNGPQVTFAFRVDPDTFQVLPAEIRAGPGVKGEAARQAILEELEHGEIRQAELVKNIEQRKLAGVTTIKNEIATLIAEGLVFERDQDGAKFLRSAVSI